MRLQNYSQGVMASEKAPTGMSIGPNKLMWLKLNPKNPDMKPDFSFVSPNPDIAGSIEYLLTMLRVFLSSKGLETDTVSGKPQSNTFSSGLERMLSMIDKFEASRTDFDLFRKTEDQLLNRMIAWSNELQGKISPFTGEPMLEDSLQITQLDESIDVNVKFAKPENIESETEKMSNMRAKIDMGIMSEVEAIMMDREVERDVAQNIVVQIAEDNRLLGDLGERQETENNQDRGESENQS